MKQDYESIKSKILKLHALAERGEQGEAINARKLLDKLLKTYGLTLDEVLGNEQIKKLRVFKITREWHEELLHQCYYKVLNVGKVSFRRGKGLIAYELTDYEYAELSSLFDWHKKQLNQELKRLIIDYVDAYIVRHDIQNNNDDDDDGQDDKYISPEERARLLRVFELSHFVEESSYHKMIE